MTTATLMTHDRRKVTITVDDNWLLQVADALEYVQARDGVWVPACDLKQYEAGRRPFANPQQGVSRS